MDCLVCGVDSVRVDSNLDGIELKCPDCGHFGISGSLLATQGNRRFDLAQTRWWFDRQRDVYPERTPIITDSYAFWAV